MKSRKLNEEDKEWIKIIRLASYKRLTINAETLENSEKIILENIKKMLLENGTTEEIIDREVSIYRNTSEEERTNQIKEKIEILVSKIANYLEHIEEISSKDYPELYYRIQELVALNPTVANELIKETFEKNSINHCMSCNDSLYGNPCTYYFSKKLTYR